MRRKTLDLILTAVGLGVTATLVVAGVLLMWGYSFANDNVHNQLAQQQIAFPTLGSPALASPQIGPYLNQYAGQQLLTGPQAAAYADHFIAVHLGAMPYGGVYDKVSTASRADPTNAALKAEVTTVFQGTTLRGLLLEAYAFWKFGQIAFYGAVVCFILAGLMALLTVIGWFHYRRTPEDLEFPKPHHRVEEKIPATV
jgi:hypothetical protein